MIILPSPRGIGGEKTIWVAESGSFVKVPCKKDRSKAS